MDQLILPLFIVVLGAFVFYFVRALRAKYPALRENITERLLRRGLSILNISDFHAQKALTLATGHIFIVCASGVVVYLASGNWLLVGIVVAIAYFFPSKWFAWQRKKRKEKIESELPDALMFLASALRAGSALSVALQILVRDQKGPLGDEFSILLKEQRLGVSFDDAIQNMAQRLDIPDFVLVVVALRVAKEVGGNLSDPLQRLAETLRRKSILEGRIKALTAQGRIQGIVMTLFPLALMAILYFMQPTMVLLFTTPIGWGVLALIAFLLTLGYLSIQKIVAIDI